MAKATSDAQAIMTDNDMNLTETVTADTDLEAECHEMKTSNTHTPPKKKLKRLSRFQKTWESDFDWCRKVYDNEYEAHCTLCNRKFSIGHGGRNDVTTHSKSDVHIRNVSAARSSSVRSYFVKSTPTGLDRQVGFCIGVSKCILNYSESNL